jgi:hypothetical protein
MNAYIADCGRVCVYVCMFSYKKWCIYAFTPEEKDRIGGRG